MPLQPVRLVPAAIIAIYLTACSTGPATNGPEASTAANTAPAPEPIEPWDGDGMDIPLDGSSLEAYERYLARVKAHTTPAHYTTLVNSVEYLLVYDLGANRDKATLVSRLNGKTGHEVLDMVSWQRGKR